MTITHLSTYDVAGGAARAAYRLHKGLCSLGEDSRLLALYKSSSDETVIEFDPPRDFTTRIRRGLRRRFLERSGKVVAARPEGATVFSDDRSQHGAALVQQLPRSDVLNLHWITNFFDLREFFRRAPPSVPIVWTLHDMNAFTGGCHYDEGCGKFYTQCGACPQLSSSDPGDLSAQIWWRKSEAYSSLGPRRFSVVTPSRWLAREVKKSRLLYGREVEVIPYGIDLEHFQPRDARLARGKYGIPSEARTVLFVAVSASEKRKGLSVLLEALKGLEHVENLFLIAIGKKIPGQEVFNRFKRIDFLEDETALSHVYSVADVFVVPSLQDNLPNTTIEALACGIPTIASNVGGIPEVVRDGETGLVVPGGDPLKLRGAIVALLGAPDRRSAMAGEARRVALQEYSLEVQARRYRALYQRLLEPVDPLV